MQVQCQLFCSLRTYCDFIVWTSEDLEYERIFPDEEFWLDCVSRVEALFINSIVPELLGKWFSRPPRLTDSSSTAAPNTPQAGTSSEVYCYCGGPDVGDMLGCDREECTYQWFHLSCLNLKTFPKSKVWYCPDCRKLKNK